MEKKPKVKEEKVFTYHHPQLTYSYGLRRVPKEVSDINGRRNPLFVVVKTEMAGGKVVKEEVIGQPQNRPIAVELLLQLVDNDPWGADEEARPRTKEEKERASL